MAAKKRGKKELYELEHRSFWIVIGMVFLLSVFTILSLINSDNLTGHATAQNIAYMKGGSNLFFEIRNVEGMQNADIELLETVKGGQIVFDGKVPIEFEGKVFNSFKVSSVDFSKLGAVTYTLKVKTSDLLPLGINPNDLKLYVNGKEADTVKTSTEGEYTFYTAKLDKFEEGDHVLGLAAAKETAKVTEEPEKQAEQEPSGSAMEEAEKEETRDALIGKAIQPSESKQGFFSKIANFFRNLFVDIK